MFHKVFFLSVLALFSFFSNPKAENLSNTPTGASQFTDFYNPQKFPQTAVYQDKNGKDIKLSDSFGKVIILNFYKATCRKCLIELPSLNSLAQKYPSIEVITISEGSEKAELIDSILHQQRRLKNLSVFTDKNQALYKLMNIPQVPYTLLINKNGFVVGYIQGLADFTAPEIYKQIENLAF